MDEWQAARQALTERGVTGAEDLGRLVNNTEHFAPSRFDERAAMPVLLDILPTTSDRKLVEALAGHLRRPWARPAAFPSVVFIPMAALPIWTLIVAIGLLRRRS